MEIISHLDIHTVRILLPKTTAFPSDFVFVFYWSNDIFHKTLGLNNLRDGNLGEKRKLCLQRSPRQLILSVAMAQF